MSDINGFRDELASIDREIMELVGRRNKIALEIGEKKAAANKEIVVPSVETNVVQRYVDAGKVSGVSAETAARIARAVIDESVDVQGMIPRRSVPQKIFIIGGNGGMGRWLSEFFSSRGHIVTINDQKHNGAVYPVVDIFSGCRNADVIIVATPIKISAEILETVLSENKNALIFDLISVKTPVIPVLCKASALGAKVCSVHPMFGSSAPSIAGRNIIVCSCGNDEAADEAADLFSGGTILRLNIEDHDPITAYVLGLSHAVNLAFSEALVRSGFSSETLCAAASTTFQRQTAVSSDVSRENGELYYSIQKENPYNEAAVQNLLDALLDLRSSNKDVFIEKMHEGAAWYPKK
ncbi:Prephenate dehydrogenase [Methanocorpusculum labreanum Z]|uniref:Prephenate dehydrogenase n=1 Tax=Methanocorpusculum labreanum (strain ATCC 43576 / DSM 4855 / Z) TaxID=410358 RepID=A2SU03_METLZ|nr:prephenate dehydrogenase/arogenate dehydrogenase family protein [Methanocorpusculum labreanum]ABN07809.1 Prephenate dehydrogenase [Methanocorpusculum labreanum Z]